MVMCVRSVGVIVYVHVSDVCRCDVYQFNIYVGMKVYAHVTSVCRHDSMFKCMVSDGVRVYVHVYVH